MLTRRTDDIVIDWRSKGTEGLDADGDGIITRDEWVAHYGTSAGFDLYDLDGDTIDTLCRSFLSASDTPRFCRALPSGFFSLPAQPPLTVIQPRH